MGLTGVPVSPVIKPLHRGESFVLPTAVLLVFSVKVEVAYYHSILQVIPVLQVLVQLTILIPAIPVMPLSLGTLVNIDSGTISVLLAIKLLPVIQA